MHVEREREWFVYFALVDSRSHCLELLTLGFRPLTYLDLALRTFQSNAGIYHLVTCDLFIQNMAG